jgi:hypothetical protein
MTEAGLCTSKERTALGELVELKRTSGAGIENFGRADATKGSLAGDLMNG